jgi:outer membrane receptor protein involved in Fe transport
MRIKPVLAILAVALSLPPPLAWADDGPPSDAGLEMVLFRDLPDIWSATRTLRSPLDVPNEVTIITAADIRDSGAVTLVELLDMVPSLEVMRVSRADVNISARGFNPIVSSRVLPMIDGRTVYINFTGVALWESLNVSLQEIERIEVIRGPGSVLYGANALMGIVNIITKRPHEMPRNSVRVGVGPETGFTNASFARWSERLSMKTSLQYRTLDNFRNEQLRFRLEPTNRHTTGLRNKMVNTTLEYLLDDGTIVSASAGLTGAKQEVLTQMGDFLLDTSIYYGKINIDKGLWKFQAFVNGMNTDLDTAGTVYPAPLPPAVPVRSDLRTAIYDVELQRTHWVGDHTFLWGVNFRRSDDTSRRFLGGREEEAIYGTFLQDEFQLGDRFLLHGGVRFDQHPKAGFQVSPRLSLVTKLGDSERLRMLWAQSYRTATHLSKYAQVDIANSDPFAMAPLIPFIPNFQYTGNDRLDPVRLDTFEIGYRNHVHEGLRFNATLYLNMLKDFQAFYYTNPANPFESSIRNMGRSMAWGLELGVEFKLWLSTMGFASYSFQSAHGGLELATPTNKVVAGLRGPVWERHPGLRYSINGRYVSHHDYQTGDVDASFIGSTDIQSRFTVDGALMYRVRPGLELGLNFQNLFHQTRRHFPLGDEIGSEITATVRWEF